jgi:hypothetical protein
VNVDYLPLGGIKSVIGQRDELLIIDVLMSKPKLRCQREFQWR